MSNSFNIVLFSGPSGGHLFPAMAFAEAMRKARPNVAIYLVTGERAKRFAQGRFRELFDCIEYLPHFPVPAGFSFRSLLFLLKLPRIFSCAFRTIRRISPDICIGFGSYVSFPGMVAAKWNGIATVIHEQNLIAGKANTWLAPHMDCIAVSFEETWRGRKRRVVTGLPLRAALTNASDAQRLAKREASEAFRILILGGSQGARRLNEAAVRAFEEMTFEERRKFSVNHITGKDDFDRVTKAYRDLGITFKTHPFFEEMERLYRSADLALTRGGANTLFELALFRVPAIVIPYPHAGRHQSANARFFAARNGVICCEEKDLSEAWLIKEIRGLQKDSSRRQAMKDALGALVAPTAADRLVSLVGQKFDQVAV